MHYGMVEKIEVFRTRDNKDFESEAAAIGHAVDLAGSVIQNTLEEIGCDKDAVRKVMYGLLVGQPSDKAMANFAKLRNCINRVGGV